MSIDSTLSRRATTEQEVSPGNRFVSTALPWLIAAAALVVYLFTLNRWISFSNLLQVGKLSGWTWQPELSEPLYWLVTYPFRWLPHNAIPIALNLLSTLCAVLTLALLARSVALLPHDRTHEQRQREHGEFSLLSIPLVWLPPVLAVLVCGLQLTFWEHATAASSEMLNLLLFAYVIRCLLEFRIDERESWLTRAALVYGLGMTNNWAMIGFFPLFLAALVWIRGLSFFNLGFLGRMFLYGLIGLLLYLLLPIVQSRADISTVPFWLGLKANLGNQEGILAMLFKRSSQTVALLGLTSLVPIFFIGIRWASYFGDNSRLGVALGTMMVHAVNAFFLVACAWVALDPPFSPRNIGLGLPFLTFYYLGALSVGYFSGYFLLVFREKNERPIDRSRRKRGYLPLINSAVTCAVFLLLVIAPLGLVYRNLAHIRTTNGPMIKQMASLLSETLPPSGAVVLSDDPRRLMLAHAAVAKTGKDMAFVFVETASLTYPDYHRFLKKRHEVRWPVDPPKTLKNLLNPLAAVPLLAALEQSNSVYYLHPSFGTYFERFYLEPHGLTYKLISYPSTNPFPPVLTQELVAENEAFWSKADAQSLRLILPAVLPPPKRAQPVLMQSLTRLAHLTAEPNRDASLLAAFYSRALDYWAVALQRKGELDKAAPHFERALELNPDNVSARLSLECNKNLRAGRETTVKFSKTIEDAFGNKYRDWNQVMTENGPFDEPSFCFAQGQVFIQARLFRQAMLQFARVKDLDHDHLPARLWLAQLYILARKPDEALRLVEEIHQKETAFKINRTNIIELLFAEASAHLALKDSAAAEAAVAKSLQKFPEDKELLEQQLKLAPDNPSALINKGVSFLQLNACEQAIPPLTRVVELQSTNYPARLNRAIAYLRCGQLEASEKDYEALQKSVPTAYPIYYGLQEIAYRKKDTNATIHYCELYLSNGPPNPEEIKFISTRLAELKQRPR